jgi:hypothetical protein
MKRKDSKFRIGVKYCGGCNPEYDRVSLVKDIEKRLKNDAQFVSWQSEDIDLLLVVCGCRTACVDLSPFEGLRILKIEKPEGVDNQLQDIKQLG